MARTKDSGRPVLCQIVEFVKDCVMCHVHVIFQAIVHAI